MNITECNKRKGASYLLRQLIEHVPSLAEHMSDSPAAAEALFDHVRRILEGRHSSQYIIAAHSSDSIQGTWASCRKLPGHIAADLEHRGVDAETIKRVSIRCAKIAWCGAHRFEFEAIGHSPWMSESEQVLVVLVRDATGCALDIVAWDSKTNRLGSWLGVVWALGQGSAFVPRLSDGLSVHRTPLQWLRAGGAGIVLLNHKVARGYLRDAGPLIVEDWKHRRELAAALTQPLPRILVVPAAMMSKEG
jgi:hypothetical protein